MREADEDLASDELAVCEVHFADMKAATEICCWVSVLVASFVLILSLLPDEKPRLRFPGRLILIFLVLSIVFCANIAVFGRFTAWRHVDDEHAAEYHLICQTQAFIFQFCGMALIGWWCALGWIFHQICKLGKPVSELQTNEVTLHVLIWPLSVLAALLPLTLGFFGRDTRSPYCWVTVADHNVWQFIFLLLPMLAAGVAGCIWGAQLIVKLLDDMKVEKVLQRGREVIAKQLAAVAERDAEEAPFVAAGSPEERLLDAAYQIENDGDRHFDWQGDRTDEEGQSFASSGGGDAGDAWEEEGPYERPDLLEKSLPAPEKSAPSFRKTVARNIVRHVVFLLLFVVVFAVDVLYAAVHAFDREPAKSLCIAASVNNALIGVYVGLVFLPLPLWLSSG